MTKHNELLDSVVATAKAVIGESKPTSAFTELLRLQNSRESIHSNANTNGEVLPDDET